MIPTYRYYNSSNMYFKIVCDLMVYYDFLESITDFSIEFDELRTCFEVDIIEQLDAIFTINNINTYIPCYCQIGQHSVPFKKDLLYCSGLNQYGLKMGNTIYFETSDISINIGLSGAFTIFHSL